MPAIELVEADVQAALDAMTQVIDNDWQVKVYSMRGKVGKPVYSLAVRSRRSPETSRMS